MKGAATTELEVEGSPMNGFGFGFGLTVEDMLVPVEFLGRTVLFVFIKQASPSFSISSHLSLSKQSFLVTIA